MYETMLSSESQIKKNSFYIDLMCVREREHVPMPGDQRTACGEWFFPPTIWGSDQTQVIRFGGNCLYPVNHLIDPKDLSHLFI